MRNIHETIVTNICPVIQLSLSETDLFTWAIKQFQKLMECRSIPRVLFVLSTENQLSTKSYPKLITRYFQFVGWYENSHHLVKFKLYETIFMSNVHQMLVDVFFKQINNMVTITCK